MIRSSIFAKCLLCIIAFASCSSKQKKERRVQDYRKADSLALLYNPAEADPDIDAFMKNLHRTRNFNGNVLVAKKGKILYQNTFGWADYLRRDSLKINSQFELASVTKPMTATAVLMLVEEGKIKLDQKVTDFYPDFPYPDVTVRMLLAHRSGLMNYVYFADNIYKKEKRNERVGMSNKDVMKLIAERKPSRYIQPNRKFHYNNSNYMILGAIIEAVSGKPFSQFMKERVFTPCGMENTAVYSKAEYEKIPADVIGHDRTWRYSVVQNFLDGPVGDKGIYSTVRDLYKFDRCMRRNQLISKQWQDSAYTGHNEVSKGHFNYGYGWRIFDAKNQKVVYHTGWWHGFRHIYLRDLENDVTVVLLSNLTNGSLVKLDDLYKIVGMPVIRKSAYTGKADPEDE